MESQPYKYAQFEIVSTQTVDITVHSDCVGFFCQDPDTYRYKFTFTPGVYFLLASFVQPPTPESDYGDFTIQRFDKNLNSFVDQIHYQIDGDNWAERVFQTNGVDGICKACRVPPPKPLPSRSLSPTQPPLI